MPSGQSNRKRNLIVTFTDKNGDYSIPKNKVLTALDKVVDITSFYRTRQHACKMLPTVVQRLKELGAWKYVTSLNFLRSYSGLALAADNEMTYISRQYRFRYINGDGNTKYDYVHIVIVLASVQVANGVTCDKPCKNQARCATPPYSSAKYCQCKPYYQGTVKIFILIRTNGRFSFVLFYVTNFFQWTLCVFWRVERLTNTICCSQQNTGCIKKSRQFWIGVQFHKSVHAMKFLVRMDCFGFWNVKKN